MLDQIQYFLQLHLLVVVLDLLLVLLPLEVMVVLVAEVLLVGLVEQVIPLVYLPLKEVTEDQEVQAPLVMVQAAGVEQVQ